MSLTSYNIWVLLGHLTSFDKLFDHPSDLSLHLMLLFDPRWYCSWDCNWFNGL